jgi:hypothetical protein
LIEGEMSKDQRETIARIHRLRHLMTTHPPVIAWGWRHWWLRTIRVEARREAATLDDYLPSQDRATLDHWVRCGQKEPL